MVFLIAARAVLVQQQGRGNRIPGISNFGGHFLQQGSDKSCVMLSTKHRVFLEVASQLSFSKASQNLFISQPAVSRHIKALEAHYQCNLFERKGNNVALTPVGKLLYDRLLQARQWQQQLEYDISTYRNRFNAKGLLKLGASTTVALYILPKVMSQFRKKYPGLDITLLNRNTEIVTHALLEHEIDLGIVEGPNKSNTIVSQPFLTDRVIAVCAAGSPLAKKAGLSVQDLPNIPVALRERGSGTLAALKQALQKQGIKLSDLPARVRLGGTEALKNFLIEDECLGFLPQRSVIKELKYGELVEVKIRDLLIERKFYFIQRKGDENDKLGREFIRFACLCYNI